MHLFGHKFDHDYYFELLREDERAAHSITRVPTPTVVLSTSLGKYQILCRIDSFTFEQESTLELLAIACIGGPERSEAGLSVDIEI